MLLIKYDEHSKSDQQVYLITSLFGKMFLHGFVVPVVEHCLLHFGQLMLSLLSPWLNLDDTFAEVFSPYPFCKGTSFCLQCRFLWRKKKTLTNNIIYTDESFFNDLTLEK